jgi:hypothetical protein
MVKQDLRYYPNVGLLRKHWVGYLVLNDLLVTMSAYLRFSLTDSSLKLQVVYFGSKPRRHTTVDYSTAHGARVTST